MIFRRFSVNVRPEFSSTAAFLKMKIALDASQTYCGVPWYCTVMPCTLQHHSAEHMRTAVGCGTGTGVPFFFMSPFYASSFFFPFAYEYNTVATLQGVCISFYPRLHVLRRNHSFCARKPTCMKRGPAVNSFAMGAILQAIPGSSQVVVHVLITIKEIGSPDTFN